MPCVECAAASCAAALCAATAGLFLAAWMKLHLDRTPRALGLDFEHLLAGDSPNSLCGGGDGEMTICELWPPPTRAQASDTRGSTQEEEQRDREEKPSAWPPLDLSRDWELLHPAGDEWIEELDEWLPGVGLGCVLTLAAGCLCALGRRALRRRDVCGCDVCGCGVSYCKPMWRRKSRPEMQMRIIEHDSSSRSPSLATASSTVMRAVDDDAARSVPPHGAASALDSVHEQT